ncbi:MAG TPA: hypothetical protein VMV29_05635 [Ktedonobacterales bacterium]|nr:hypothetical protein [Ktedonobacterales bacterium]
MADLTPLLGALDMTPAEIQATGRRVERWRVILFATVYALFLALVGLEVYGAIYGWQTTDWATFWYVTLFPLLLLLYVPFPYFLRNPYSQQLSAATNAYHEAALATQRTPAPTNGEPHALTDRPEVEVERSSSFRLRRTPLPVVNPGPAYIGFMSPYFGLVFAAVGWSLSRVVEDRGPFAMFSAPHWVYAAPGALLFCLGVAVVLRAYWNARPLRVRVDAHGVRWNRRRFGRAHLQWGDAQSFSMLSYGGLSESSRTRAYVLDGRDVSLAWMVPASYWGPRRLASQALCDAITHYTGLQLQHLTQEAEQIVAPLPPSFVKQTSHPWRALRNFPRRLAMPFWQSEPAPAAPIGVAPAGATSATRRIHPTWYPTLTMFLLATVLCVGGFGAQWYQSYAYAHLVANASSHTPLFADDLAAPDGQWPLKPTRPGDDGSYGYANGAYQLTIGQGVHPAYAWAPGTYNNIVAEVSAQINANFDLSGIGLIIRSRDSQAIVAFTATPSGDVWVYTFTDAEANSGRTNRLSIYWWSPVNKAAGAWNRFAVIVRDGIDILVLNGHLIGAMVTHDTQPVQVGVYLENTATSGAFKDFAIYRV